MRVRALSNQPTQTLSWLWPGRLALGKLAMLDGDPGLGKSHLALDLCARLSTGRPFPDDRPGPGIASAIVFNAEDGEGDTTRPRLERLGADLDRIYSVEPDDADSFRLPTSLPALEDLLSSSIRSSPSSTPPSASAATRASAPPSLRSPVWPTASAVPSSSSAI